MTAHTKQEKSSSITELTTPITTMSSDPTWKLLLAGGVAGAVSRTCTSPLERLKILLQVQTMSSGQKHYNGIFRSLITMLHEEGFYGFFKGNGTNVLRIAPYSAVQFLAYERYKKLMTLWGDERMSTVNNLIAGGAAGSTALIITYPLDLIRARLTVQTSINNPRYTGISDAFKIVVKEEGFFALYKGVGTSLFGIAPYVAINFTTYERLKQTFVAPGKIPTVTESLFYGGLSGAVAQTLTYPIDLLRRRMQLQGLGGQKALYSGPLDAVKQIIAKEGIAGLYQGMIACYLKVIPSIAISFCVYEIMKTILKINKPTTSVPT